MKEIQDSFIRQLFSDALTKAGYSPFAVILFSLRTRLVSIKKANSLLLYLVINKKQEKISA